MIGLNTLEKETTSSLCAACGIPLDSQYFDDSSVQEAPLEIGSEVVLARFDLPAQYCGVLQYFSQFTDLVARDFTKIQTPQLEWRILANNHALFPYINLKHIVNPWGYGSFPVNIRLDEASTVELVVRAVADNRGAPPVPDEEVKFVGGRIMGRFWYNASYGDVVSRRA